MRLNCVRIAMAISIEPEDLNLTPFNQRGGLGKPSMNIRRRLSALFSWLRKQNRVAANPFELVTKVDARGKESFHRRALNDDEARRLLAGPHRPLYLLALHTGLRRGEINALALG